MIVNNNNFIKNHLNYIEESQLLEYIFVDDLNQLNKTTINNILDNDSYLLSYDKNNNLIMINDINSKRLDSDILSYIPEMDLILLNNQLNDYNNLNKIISKHTLITKNFNNKLIYTEDQFKNKRVLTTNKNSIIITGSGLNTKIQIKQENL